MGNYEQLKDAIKAVIKTNGNQEITGEIMQQTLLTIVSSVGKYGVFGGIATPSTNPGAPDQNVFYIAGSPGRYDKFGNVFVENCEIAILECSTGNWQKVSTPIANTQEIKRARINFTTGVGTKYDAKRATISSIYYYTPGMGAINIKEVNKTFNFSAAKGRFEYLILKFDTGEVKQEINVDQLNDKDIILLMYSGTDGFVDGELISDVLTKRAKIANEFAEKTELEINEYNISALNSGAKYESIQSAVTALDSYLSVEKKNVGVKVTFIKSISDKAETWQYQGGAFAQSTSWTNQPLGGYNRKLLSSLHNVKFNERTGFYELNGLTDIKTNEMETILRESNMFLTHNGFGMYVGCYMRTNLENYSYLNLNGIFNGEDMFYKCYNLEVLKFYAKIGIKTFKVNSLKRFLYDNKKLRSVIGDIEISNSAQTDGDFISAFFGCQALETIHIANVYANVSFNDSPNLTKDSILFLINNSNATKPIAVTLHPTAYAMAQADTEIQAALGDKTNVSLKEGGATK